MREIKFRAWYMEDKRLVNWGSIRALNNFIDLIDCSGKIVEQYTGLKDKNGVEIYEGDIVSYEYEFFESFVDSIVFENGMFCYSSDEDPETFLQSDVKDKTVKIIGNIHENPELLKENK